MKIKKKAREQTVMEKRNNTITQFVLVALVPLLLTFLLGFSLGKADDVNKANLLKQIENLGIQKDSIAKVNQELIAQTEALMGVFLKADTLIDNFEDIKVKQLEDQLDAAAKSDPIDRESAFSKWKDDKDASLRDLKNDIKFLGETHNYFRQIPALSELLESGKRWLEKYADTKGYELLEKMLKKKLQEGADISKDLQDQIDDLTMQLGLKDIELRQSQMSGNDKVGSIAEDKADIQAKLDALTALNEQIKSNITGELDEIQATLIPELKPGSWFNRNEDEINDFKQKLTTKLRAIERNAAEL